MNGWAQRYVIPLYDSEEGGPARAFGCGLCNAVCRTVTGLWSHLRIVHDIKQEPMFFEGDKDAKI
jgi:hypothetical protein